MSRTWKYTIYALLFILFMAVKHQSDGIKSLQTRIERLENGECLIDTEDEYVYQED